MKPHRVLALWESFLGPEFQMERLGPREFNAFKRQRASGEIDGRGRRVQDRGTRRPVSPRTVAKNLKTLKQVCRFGAGYRRQDGSFLLRTDPTRELDLPSEKNPARPVADDERYEASLKSLPRSTAFCPTSWYWLAKLVGGSEPSLPSDTPTGFPTVAPMERSGGGPIQISSEENGWPP